MWLFIVERRRGRKYRLVQERLIATSAVLFRQRLRTAKLKLAINGKTQSSDNVLKW